MDLVYRVEMSAAAAGIGKSWAGSCSGRTRQVEGISGTEGGFSLGCTSFLDLRGRKAHCYKEERIVA